MTTNANKHSYLKCAAKKCSKEGAALLKLEGTLLKELQSIEKNRKSGRISPAQLDKQLKHIGEASGVKKAAQKYTKCHETKCAKEKKAYENSKK